MKKILVSLFIFVLLFSSFGLALPDQWGRGVNNPKGDITLTVKDVGFIGNLFSSIGLFTISGLEPTYSEGDTIHITTREKLYTACNSAYLTVEIYSASSEQQTGQNYVGGSNQDLGYLTSGVYKEASFNFQLPGNARDISKDWSISSYIYCSDDTTPASTYSTVTEMDFEVSGFIGFCSDDCNLGETICMTKGGYANRYIGECGSYDADICLEFPTSLNDLEDCGGIDLCSNGVCVSAPPTTIPPIPPTTIPVGEGNIKLISKDLAKGTNMVQGTFVIENIGNVKVDGIVEMQVNPYGTGLLAIVPTTTPIETCDSLTPRNVNKKFSLNSGDSTTIELTSPIVGVIADGNYDVYVLARKGCKKDIEDNELLTDPAEFGYNAIKLETITIDTGQDTTCGDGKCQSGEEESCLDDCSDLFECNKDGFCSSIETCDCSDCFVEERCDLNDACAKPLPISEKLSMTNNPTVFRGKCLVGISFLGLFDCVESKVTDLDEFLSTGTTLRCSDSLTKKEFKTASDYQLMDSLCEESRNCAPREGYDVSCVRESIVNVKIPTSVLDWWSEHIAGNPVKGVCLAEAEDEGIDFGWFTESTLIDGVPNIAILLGISFLLWVIFRRKS